MYFLWIRQGCNNILEFFWLFTWWCTLCFLVLPSYGVFVESWKFKPNVFAFSSDDGETSESEKLFMAVWCLPRMPSKVCWWPHVKLLVAVLRSVSKIQLLLCYQTKWASINTQLNIKLQPFTKVMSGAFRRSDYELIRLLP